MQGLADEQGRGSGWSALPLYLGFAATGVGVALPGALLPALLQRWHLQDEQGGRLFLMAWMGSSLGALLIRWSLRLTLLVGSLGVVVGAGGLAVSQGSIFGVDALMALYGFGLGMTMTSISLIRQRQTGASGTEMVRLNLLWAIGACVCPSLTLHAVRAGRVGPVLLGVAGCFGLLSVATLWQPEWMLERTEGRACNVWAVFQRVPAGLILMVFLITGVEASAGGWLTTYARRGGHGTVEAIAAPSCLWAGLLLSRLFWSVFHEWMTEAKIVRGSLMLMVAAAVLMVGTSQGLLMLAAAFALGFGIGPTFPLLLGWALRKQQGGTIFFVAGMGSACLPWLTGAISGWQGSLRTGLTVPMAGAVVMLAIAAMGPVGRWSERKAIGLGG